MLIKCIISVAKDCKKEGLQIEKSDICKSVSDVMNFFFNAKSTDGKKVVSRKSTNLAEKIRLRQCFGSGGGVYSKFWSSISQFEDRRKVKNCLIASCNFDVRQCVKSLDQPFLIISSSDLNEKDFGKELGRVLLEEKCTICVETGGLTRLGSTRIVSFLKLAGDLFDSRVRFIIFGEAGLNADIDQFSEKHFLLEDLSEFGEQSNPKTKLGKVQPIRTTQGVSKEVEELKKEAADLRKQLAAKTEILSEIEEKFIKSVDHLKVTDEELEATKNELDESGVKLQNAEKERDNLKSENIELQSKFAGLKQSYDQKCGEIERKSRQVLSEMKGENQELKEKSEKDEKMISELQSDISTETGLLQKRISELEEEVIKFKRSPSKCSYDNSNSPPRGQQTQTDRVVISPTPLAIVKENLKKNEGPNSVDKVYKSVKELKCNMTFSESSSGLKCEVEIVRGKNISSYPLLCHFIGVGKNRHEAKVAAFSNFVSAVVQYQE